MSQLSAMTRDEVVVFVVLILIVVYYLIAAIFSFTRPGKRFLCFDPAKQPGDPRENSMKDGFFYLGMFISFAAYAVDAYFGFDWPTLVIILIWVAPTAVLTRTYRLILKKKSKAAKAEEA